VAEGGGSNEVFVVMMCRRTDRASHLRSIARPSQLGQAVHRPAEQDVKLMDRILGLRREYVTPSLMGKF
jgi:hypothetical protein